VVADGGGTVADVINETGGALPLAVLPLGNENLFARAFGFTSDAGTLACAIAGGRTRTIDLGQANGRLFALMLGVGFDADVAHRVARWRAPTPSSSTSPPMRTAGPRLSGPRRRKCRTLVRSSAPGDPPSPFA